MITSIFDEVFYFVITRGLPIVGLVAAIHVYVQEYIRQMGIEPDTHWSWIFAAGCFVLTPVAFWICRKVRRYHQQKVGKIYQSLLSGETLES
ncbi:MAG: hypothetical protein LBU65_07770 [Planctomycetaceae bacterium]|nr:hypothetical protein [Planctomycetaceae bacterium]